MLILFGHQSVGQNLLDGVRGLAQDGIETPLITALHDCPLDNSRVTLVHFQVGTNGQPLSKLEHFAQVLEGDAGRRANLAMFKFCYVDIQVPEAAQRLFDSYSRTLDLLHKRRPDLQIAHVTVPLRYVPEPRPAFFRRLFGRRHSEVEKNLARQIFNERLRNQHASGPWLFDLAAIEAASPGGRVCVTPGQPGPVPMLCPKYTHDGGHLNELGRRILAEAFIRFIGRINDKSLTPRPATGIEG